MKCVFFAVLFVSASCVSSGGQDPVRPPPDGNALVSVSDMVGEHPGTLRLTIGSSDPDHIGFGLTSVTGFGASYTVEEWGRLLEGEALPLINTPGNVHRFVGTVYEVRPDVRIGRNGTSERLTRSGNQWTWQVEFGEATDSFGNVLTEEDPSVTVTVAATPDVICTGCIPGTEFEGGGCIVQYDPMYQSEYCRDAIERLNLVENGLVDGE